MFGGRLEGERLLLPQLLRHSSHSHCHDQTTNNNDQKLFNEAGVPIEPFHLRREREEGAFDADGNYVAHRRAEPADDAWLESLGVRARLIIYEGGVG